MNIFREGFESGKWTHNVKVFPVGEDPYKKEIGNIFTPKDWLAWFKHDPRTWDQPEGRNTWEHIDPRRIHSGAGAYLLFSFYRHHDCGLMRQVEVTAGTKLRFTAWAHAWSNTSLEGHEGCLDDGHCSCGVGRQVIAIAAEDIPEPSGDPWSDAIGNSVFVLGIDPNGGEDPFSLDVEWGPAFAVYNGYAEQLEVEAVAGAGGTVTVFLRNITLYGFKHNDAYWDNAVLETVDDGPPHYESTMLVLPQDATTEQLQEIFALAYPDKRTFGFSHDDAGNLHGTSVCYNIPDDKKDDYLNFYATRYPDVKVKFAYTSDWDSLLLWQCDPRWKDEKVASADCDLTLCQTGCWISDCAMAQRFFGIKSDATPSIANQALGAASGFDGCMTHWNPMKSALGLEVVRRSYDDAEAQAWLNVGNILFAEVEPDDFMHFVLVTHHQDGRFWMHDPYKNVMGWMDEHYPGIESWRLIRPFEPSPPPPPVGPLMSLHLQSLVEGALDFVARVEPNVVKIFQLENAPAIKAASPRTKVILRYYTSNQDLSGDLVARAREYVASFEDSLRANAEWIDYVESYNEEIPTNDTAKLQLAVEFDCHFADALMALGLPVAPVLLNVAVGNPHHLDGPATTLPPFLGPPNPHNVLSLRAACFGATEIELMLPAVRKAIQYGGALGYHAYGLAVNGSNLNDNWPYYAGRALEGWDPVFRSHGLYPMYIFGECGAFATCSDGWRASNCLNGDWPLYLSQLREFSDRIKAWNATHGNRCLGGTLFTSGTGCGWDSFQIRAEEMGDLDWPL